MTAEEILARARERDLASLSADTAAVARAVDELVASGKVESALELVGRAWRIWSSAGKLEEGAAAARRALDAPSSPPPGVWRARALYGDGVIAFRAGDGARSRARNEEVLRLARGGGDVRGECDGLTGLARLALREGDYAAVVRLAREARERARQAGDAEAEASPLHLEAAGVRLQQRYDDARALYRESLALNERLGNAAFIAMERHNLGWVELHRGDVDAAEKWFRERDESSPPDVYGDAWKELNWAGVAVARGRVEEAKRRLAAGVAAIEGLGVALDPDDRFEYDWLQSKLGAARC